MKLEELLKIPGIKKIKRTSWHPFDTVVEIDKHGALIPHSGSPAVKLQWTKQNILATDWVAVDPVVDPQLEVETYVLTNGEDRFRYLLRGPKGMNLVEMMQESLLRKVLRSDNTDIVAQFVQMLMDKHEFELLEYTEACIR